ncbi:hypothetical protein CT138_06650 [Mannheimia varigena]|uniref:hypothetical protein n=1 Tax=Mannheimia varigena TaxID=85404 RepID=UPI000DBF31D8|nr:hypothetical protein [Mannheimia varigena]AWW34553.1 hypothetical protein CT138_06650 [Mannheimia varigena]
MRQLSLIFSLLISGCYLANGSPNSYTFWIKDGRHISTSEMRYCFEKNKSKLGSENKKRLEYLENLYEKLGYLNMKAEYPNEYEEYRELRKSLSSNSSCYYDLGYRFKAPLYWCMAQDGDNTRICSENAKYRN